jgi:DNA replication protein DnaC
MAESFDFDSLVPVDLEPPQRRGRVALPTRVPFVGPPVTSAGDGLMRCALHGVFRMRTVFGRAAACPDCGHSVREGHTPEQAAHRAEGLAIARLGACGIRGRYVGATLDSFTATTLAQRAVLKSCRAYADTVQAGAGGGLMLLGPVGTGKTHLLAAMARHMRFERAVTAKVITPREIVRELRACWSKDAEKTEEDVISGYSRHLDVLLLDEAGMGFGSDAELTQLFEVIDARYALGNPTVVASNLALPEMKHALGDRIFDRLREGAQVLTLVWPSHRGTV